MSEIEIKQMQTKKEDGELVVVRDGKVVRIKARDLK